MSALECAVQSGSYMQALKVYEAIPHPSPVQTRWAGWCALHLGELVQARRLLLLAIHGGAESARIDLAACLRFLGDFPGARAQLDLLDLAQLSSRDAALALREQAILTRQSGRSAQSIELLEQAWGQAVGASLEVQATVAYSLALALSALGREYTASSYLRFAEMHAAPGVKPYVLLAQATCATMLGQYNIAQSTLNQVFASENPLIQPVAHYHLGNCQRAQGATELALKSYSLAVVLSIKAQQPETECFAHLALTALATGRADVSKERFHLTRARALVTSPRAHAYVCWRSGAAMARTDHVEAEALFERALCYFRSTENSRETVWVLLHFAEAYLKWGQPQHASQTIKHAADVHISLGAEQQLYVELQALPLTLNWLKALPTDAYEAILINSGPNQSSNLILEVYTLGKTMILMNGSRIRLQLKKSVEVLTFLLKHSSASLMDLQSAVFTDIPGARSKNYFHQVRLELKRLIPGLDVSYCRNTKRYSVILSRVNVQWDVQKLEQAIEQSSGAALLSSPTCVRDFLPESGSDWVVAERDRMSRWIVRIGLETMEKWYQDGEYSKCLCLTERLIEIDPLDLSLHVMLIQATGQLNGLMAAYAVIRQSQAYFKKEVGEIPSSLSEIQYLKRIHLN